MRKLVVLAVALVTVALVWLGARPRVQRWARDRLARVATQHVRGTVEVGELHGSLVGSVDLRQVIVRDLRGRVVLSARRVRLEYSLWSFFTRHLRMDEIVVEGARADVAALEDDRLHLAPLIEKIRELGKSATLADVRLKDTRLVREGDRLDDTDAQLSAELAAGGERGELRLSHLHGRFHLHGAKTRPLSLAGQLSWKDGAVEASGVRAQLGESRLLAKGELSRRRIDLEVRELDVRPGDFHAMIPLEEPPAPITGHVSAHGLRTQVVTKIDLRPGKGHIFFDGVIDERHHHITAVVDHDRLDGAFFPTRPPFVFNGRVRLDVHVDDKGIRGPVQVENGAGSVANALVDHVTANARFIGKGIDFGYAAGDLPGASATMRAHILFAGDVHLEFRAHVTDLGKLVSVTKGHIELPTTGSKSFVTLEGELDKPRKGKAKTRIRKIGLWKNVARRWWDQAPL